ncbi:MAG: outer membrane beta-barrel protein [Pseudomonadota bacterium]
MNKNLYPTLALAAMFALPAARAADNAMYAGATIGTGGSLIIGNNAGVAEKNTNHPRPFKLYGGYELTDNVALEGGYINFGKFKFASPGAIEMDAWHLAAKGTIPLGKSFSLFGKLGVARHGVEASGMGDDSGKLAETKPLVGIGAAYRLTENLSLTAEYTNYGSVNSGKIKNRVLEAGLKFNF